MKKSISAPAGGVERLRDALAGSGVGPAAAYTAASLGREMAAADTHKKLDRLREVLEFKIDALGSRVEGRLSLQDERNERFRAAVMAKLDLADERLRVRDGRLSERGAPIASLHDESRRRFESLNGKIDNLAAGHGRRIDGIDSKMTRLTATVTEQSERLNAVGQSLAGMDERFDRLEQKLDQVFADRLASYEGLFWIAAGAAVTALGMSVWGWATSQFGR